MSPYIRGGARAARRTRTENASESDISAAAAATRFSAITSVAPSSPQRLSTPPTPSTSAELNAQHCAISGETNTRKSAALVTCPCDGLQQQQQQQKRFFVSPAFRFQHPPLEGATEADRRRMGVRYSMLSRRRRRYRKPASSCRRHASAQRLRIFEIRRIGRVT
jgi:hypothetical protein